jgi:hypothetical protein
LDDVAAVRSAVEKHAAGHPRWAGKHLEGFEYDRITVYR